MKELGAEWYLTVHSFIKIFFNTRYQTVEGAKQGISIDRVKIYLLLLLTSSMDAPNTFPALFLPIFLPNLATFYPFKVPENSKGDLERDCSQFPDWLDGLAAARKVESTPLHIPMMLNRSFCPFSQTLLDYYATDASLFWQVVISLGVCHGFL